jgi:hypothetical protein
VTCRCSCKAYGGACDCRFDGINAGRNDGAKRIAELELTMARLATWTRSYGAELNPPGPDTYGEGVRHAKDRVKRILDAAEHKGENT